MFGYLKPEIPELRIREHQYYRALYCGLCHRMGRCTGQCSRFTLSYDFVFLATVRLALTGEAVAIQKKRCILHPFRARPTAQKCKALDECADASALLVYRKILDDIRDENGKKRLRAFILRPVLALSYRRARKRMPQLDEKIASHLARLSEMESNQALEQSADTCAEVFGELLADVASQGLCGTDARVAREMGQAIGRWIYLIDAADDFCEDKKRGRFNPLLHTLGSTPSATDWETVNLSLTAHLCRAEQAFLLIDGYTVPEQKEILSNILYIGLPKIAEEVTVTKHTDCAQSTKKRKGK